MLPGQAPYSISKIAAGGGGANLRAVFDPPVMIARMGAAYGERGGLPVWHLHAIAKGEPVRTRFDPMPYSAIHDDDIAAQLEPLLRAASVPATIVNWAGDEPGDRAAVVGVFRGAARCRGEGDRRGGPRRVDRLGPDATRRRAITGPCRVDWRTGFRRLVEHFFPDRLRRGD